MVARDENYASDASFYYKLELISNNWELAEPLTHAQISGAGQQCYGDWITDWYVNKTTNEKLAKRLKTLTIW